MQTVLNFYFLSPLSPKQPNHILSCPVLQPGVLNLILFYVISCYIIYLSCYHDLRFDAVLPKHVDHHTILTCWHFGAPVCRSRAYDAIVSKRYVLEGGLTKLHQLATKCVLDSSVWLQASEKQARCAYIT